MLSYYLLSSANKYIGVAEFGKYWEWLKAEGSLLFVVCWQRIDKDSDKDSDKANDNFLPLS